MRSRDTRLTGAELEMIFITSDTAKERHTLWINGKADMSKLKMHVCFLFERLKREHKMSVSANRGDYGGVFQMVAWLQHDEPTLSPPDPPSLPSLPTRRDKRWGTSRASPCQESPLCGVCACDRDCVWFPRAVSVHGGLRIQTVVVREALCVYAGGAWVMRGRSLGKV